MANGRLTEVGRPEVSRLQLKGLCVLLRLPSWFFAANMLRRGRREFSPPARRPIARGANTPERGQRRRLPGTPFGQRRGIPGGAGAPASGRRRKCPTSPLSYPTSEGKQSQTAYEQHKRRRHRHGVTPEVDGRFGGDGRRGREDNQKEAQDGTEAWHTNTSRLLILRRKGQSIREKICRAPRRPTLEKAQDRLGE
jgi:hypothetical protein